MITPQADPGVPCQPGTAIWCALLDAEHGLVLARARERWRAFRAARDHHPVLGFLGGGGAMLADPFGALFLMPSMASTLRVPASGVTLSALLGTITRSWAFWAAGVPCWRTRSARSS